MDGVDVLRTLKQTPSTTDIPVLIISSPSEKNGKKLIQEGAAGCEKGSMIPERLENAVTRNPKGVIIDCQIELHEACRLIGISERGLRMLAETGGIE